jgi:hypothetical protein
MRTCSCAGSGRVRVCCHPGLTLLEDNAQGGEDVWRAWPMHGPQGK